MGEIEEQKVVCRYCNKICKSGKSLGGHMRSHLDLIYAANKKKKVKPDNNLDSRGVGVHNDDDDDDNGDSGVEISVSQSSENWIQDEGDNCTVKLEMEDQDQDRNQDHHVLRKNPKKSWKDSDLRIKSCRKKRVSCRECSKKFRSSRALSVHMRTHSTLSTTTAAKSGHSCSKCGRNFDSPKALFGHMKSHSKKSSRVSADQSEGCLSDFEFYHPKKKRSITRYRTSVVSSEKESASLNAIDEEAAVSLIMLSMGIRDHQESSSNANSAAFCKRDFVKTESIADEVEADYNPMHMPSSCLLFSSAYFYCLDIKTEHETSVDMCSDLLDDGNKMTRPSCSISKANMVDTDFEALEDSGKKKEYKCKRCNKVFQSHQALGGHSNRHKPIFTTSTSDAVTYDLRSSDEAAPTGDSTMATPDLDLIRSSVKYECEICFKIFPSGNALGGHKRAHYNGLNANRIKDIEPVLDLNPPMTIPHLLNTNRTDDDTEFGHQCEPMVLVM